MSSPLMSGCREGKQKKEPFSIWEKGRGEGFLLTERAFKATGLVLRTRNLGEADRLVTILTFEEGKLEAVARGARKIKSKLAAGIDLFTFGNYNFHQGRTWPIITGQDPIERFNRFREDPDLYSYGLYLNELTDRLVSGSEKCREISNLLLEGWRCLEQGVDCALLARAYELKLANAAGYNPHLHCCTSCGSTGPSSFSPRQGGLLCSSCSSADVINITPGTLALARRMIETPMEKISLLRPSALQKKELATINAAFYAHHLDLSDIKSRKMLPQ
jgi:DNA repair protein RecO (recombination protein O)